MVVGALATIAAGFVMCARQPTQTSVVTPATGGSARGSARDRIAIPSPPPSSKIHGALRLEGQVIDDAHHPVAGANVVLANHDLIATSGEDGTFAFDQVAAGTYQLGAQFGELYAAVRRVRLSTTSEPVILRMRRGSTLIISVDAEGAPLAGARVVRQGWQEVITGPDGVAKLAGLRPHFHSVEITAAGFAPMQMTMMLADDPGGVLEQRVTLRRGAALAGVVLDPDGKPLADASVDISKSDTSADDDGWSTRVETDATGHWRCDVAAGLYQLQASSEIYGRAPDVAVASDGKAPVSGIVLRVERDAQIVGAVVDTDGKAVAAATVFVLAGNTDYSDATDMQGRFELLGIDPGDYDVFAVGEGLGCEPTRVAVADGERAEIKLTVVASNISGVVVDDKGEPIALAEVSAMPEGRVTTASFGRDITDSKGRFDLGGLPPGDYKVSALWPDQDEHRLGEGTLVHTGTKDVRLVLSPPGTIKGRVVLDGKPVIHFGLLLTERPQFWWIGTPLGVHGSDGRFVLRDVDPGTWGIVIIGTGSARKTLDKLTIKAGQVMDLGDIELAHGQRISGRVLGGTDTPVAGAQVSIGPTNLGIESTVAEWFGARYRTVSDATGTYRFDGVAIGKGTSVVATHPQHGTSAPTALPDDGDAVIDLRIMPTGGIDGVVEGRDRDSGLVIARSTADAHRRLTANISNGAFRFDGLVPGEYAISNIGGPGKVGATVKVSVVANERVTAKLETGDKRIALTIKVLGGDCQLMMVVPPGTETPKPGAEGMQRCSNNEAQLEIAPGNYRACPDLRTCVPITVAQAPATQTLTIRAPSP